MKILASVFPLLLVACVTAPHTGQTVIRGVLQVQPYTLPTGEPAKSIALRLERGIDVAGLAGPADIVEVTFPERYHVTLGQYTGQVVEIVCQEPVYASTLWGYRHASCSVASMRAAP